MGNSCVDVPPARARSITGLLAAVPMALAVMGAWWDERAHLGFTTWLGACRGAGLRLASVIDFTLQLLPFAVLGVLAGGLLLLTAGFASRRGARSLAHCALPAHAGCALALVPGLLLCASGVAWPLALGVELALAAAVAIGIDAVRVSVVLRTARASGA